MEWVSVKDRLPEESGEVMAARVSPRTGECVWVLNVEYSNRHKAFNCGDDEEFPSRAIPADYWAAMPKFPKGV